MRRISRFVLLSLTAFVAVASSSVAWSAGFQLAPVQGTALLESDAPKVVVDPNAGRIVFDREAGKLILQPNPGSIVLDLDVGVIDVDPNAGQFVLDRDLNKYVVDPDFASNGLDLTGSKFVFDPNTGKVVFDPEVGKLVFDPNPAPGNLEPDVANCIRNSRPWSECYNLQKSVVNGRQPEVNPEFKGFHDDMFRHDTKIRSIWVPSPAERWSRAAAGGN